MHTQVYPLVDGRCDEALDFYKKNLGIEVEMLMRFKDAPKGSHVHARQRQQGDAFLF